MKHILTQTTNQNFDIELSSLQIANTPISLSIEKGKSRPVFKTLDIPQVIGPHGAVLFD